MRWMRSLSWRHYLVLGVVSAGIFGVVTLQKNKTPVTKSRWVTGNGVPSPSTFPSVVEEPPTKPTNIGHKPKLVGSSGKGFLGQGCTAAEYRGEGLARAAVKKEDWDRLKVDYHAIKRELVQWIRENGKELPAPTVEKMIAQIQDLRIQRAPTPEEPDLSWRGIGAYTFDNNGSPVLRMGGGFVTLFKLQPKRARFELARLIAQAWTPCELERVAAAKVWDPLLSCLDIKETSACAEGSYSEGGWAVSSALATMLSPPECTLPVFKNPQFAKCMKESKVQYVALAPVEPAAPVAAPSATPERAVAAEAKVAEAPKVEAPKAEKPAEKAVTK